MRIDLPGANDTRGARGGKEPRMQGVEGQKQRRWRRSSELGSNPPPPVLLQKSAQAIGEKEVEVKKEVYGKWKSAERAENKEVARASP